VRVRQHGPVIYARAAIIAASAVLCALITPQAVASDTDTRQVFGPESPQWLRAVGRLQVPTRRYTDGRTEHHREDCSATLVSGPVRRSADTLVTAWHCLEHYRDLSRPISFTARDNNGRLLSREAYRLADGGGMHGDWAILRLYRPIDREVMAALPLHPRQADPARQVTMAGYSRDAGLGEHGERLTYDAGCRIIAQAREGNDSDCLAYKGASGGAVVQLSTTGEPLYAGVISRGDSEGLSIYVPISRFRLTLQQHLR
jgi:hypothetical protein